MFQTPKSRNKGDCFLVHVMEQLKIPSDQKKKIIMFTAERVPFLSIFLI